MAEKQVIEEVKYEFTRSELLALGDELARANDEVRELEARKKEATSQISAELKKADGRRFTLAGKIRDRYEMREVQCIAYFGVPRAGMKTIRRADNGEELHQAPMTADEMQAGLDFGSTAEGGTDTPTQ